MLGQHLILFILFNLVHTTIIAVVQIITLSLPLQQPGTTDHHRSVELDGDPLLVPLLHPHRYEYYDLTDADFNIHAAFFNSYKSCLRS